MAAKKKTEKTETDTVRVNLTLSREEFERLEQQAEKDQRQPGTLARLYVLKGLDAAS